MSRSSAGLPAWEDWVQIEVKTATTELVVTQSINERLRKSPYLARGPDSHLKTDVHLRGPMLRLSGTKKDRGEAYPGSIRKDYERARSPRGTG
jgi:hypothetical protein